MSSPPVIAAGYLLDGRYRLEAPLGEGGFGSVWLAADVAGDRRVAVKFLKLSTDWAKQRFAVEAQALGRLHHTGCVTILDHGQVAEPQLSFIVTEYLPGRTLDQWARVGQPLERVISVARQIAETLDAAHRLQIIHRDLKPRNVVIREEADGAPVAKIVDFGIAKLTDEQSADITKTGEVIGSVGYMSPEQLRGSRDIGPTTDLYCLGVLLFEMLTGRPPFVGATPLETSMMHLLDAPPALPEQVPAVLRELVSRLLAKDPADRYGSARLVVQRLEVLVPTATLDFIRPPAAADRKTWIPAAAAFVVVLVLAGAALVFRSPPTVGPVPASKRANAWIKTPQVPVATDLGAALPDLGPPTLDLGPPLLDLGPPEAATGCGSDAVMRGRTMVGDTLVYVPTSYDVTVPAPAVLVLHEGKAPLATMDEFDVVAAAEKYGFVGIAPQYTPTDEIQRLARNTWGGEAYATAWRDLSEVRSKFCLDDERLFVLGHASSGYAADRIATAYPDRVSAVATTSHRASRGDLSQPTGSVRRLFVAPIDDDNDPVNGGRGRCASLEAKLPLSEHENYLKTVHGCASTKPRRTKLRGGTCSEWTCETPLTMCRISGGRHFQAIPGAGKCDGRPSEFPGPEVIWEFFFNPPNAVPRD